MSDDIGQALRSVLGERAVVTDPGVLAANEVDWTRRFRGRAVALIWPGSAAEVGAALRACAAAGVAVVPQGGNTGLVAGAVPHDAVVLSTAQLASIGEVDAVASEVTAGAGATLERVQRAAAEAGLAFGVDLAARGSATVGGMIATDAGGIHAFRYGSMRRQVVGIEAVLADGTVVRQRGGSTAPAGVDMVSLLSGSEGTLAVITEARLRLVPVLPERATALVALDDVAAAVAATAHARARLPELEAVELVDAACLALVASRAGQPVPFDGSGPALLVETASTRPMLDDLSAALQSMPGMRDAVVAADGPGRRRLWALREGVTEAISFIGIPHKLDVGVPLGRLAAFVEELEPWSPAWTETLVSSSSATWRSATCTSTWSVQRPRTSAWMMPFCAWCSTTAARSPRSTASVGRRHAGSGSRGPPRSLRSKLRSSARWIREGCSTRAYWMDLGGGCRPSISRSDQQQEMTADSADSMAIHQPGRSGRGLAPQQGKFVTLITRADRWQKLGLKPH